MSACNDVKDAPKGIDADGTTYIACRGYVTISGNMQEGYEVRFTDDSGLDHDVRGIHKLEVEDLPDKSLCKTTASKSESNGSSNGVSEACKQARANGTAMKWNEGKKAFDINPVCIGPE
jgi:hypothetical protein